jgi:hypothetical protein
VLNRSAFPRNAHARLAKDWQFPNQVNNCFAQKKTPSARRRSVNCRSRGKPDCGIETSFWRCMPSCLNRSRRRFRSYERERVVIRSEFSSTRSYERERVDLCPRIHVPSNSLSSLVATLQTSAACCLVLAHPRKRVDFSLRAYVRTTRSRSQLRGCWTALSACHESARRNYCGN